MWAALVDGSGGGVVGVAVSPSHGLAHPVHDAPEEPLYGAPEAPAVPPT